MSRGRLEYTGFAQPDKWAAPSLAALPVAQELLVVPDLHKDHRYALGALPSPSFARASACGHSSSACSRRRAPAAVCEQDLCWLT